MASSAALAASPDTTRWRQEVEDTTVLRRQGAYDEAERRLSVLVAEIRRVNPDSFDLAAALNAMALLQADRGNLAAAEQTLLRSLHIWEEGGEAARPALNQCISNLVSIYLDRGEWDRAEHMIEQRLAIDETHHDPALAGLLHHLAALHLARGDHRKALPMTERAIELWRQYAGPRDTALAPMNNTLGLLYAEMGQPELALKHLNEALDILGVTGDLAITSKIRLNIALVYTRTRRYAEAHMQLIQAREAITSAVGTDHPLLATLLLEDAHALRKLGRKAEAKEADRMAAALLKSGSAPATQSHVVDVKELAAR